MGADSFFRMGSTHHVCQDYAASGESNGLTYAALSDGCSSSPDTDFGARFLVQAFRNEVEWDPSALSLAAAASKMAEAAGLSNSCLDATLLMVIMGDMHAEIWRAGDGVVAWRRRDGRCFFNQIAFGQNAPRYLSYQLSPELERQHRLLSPEVTVRVGVRDAPGSAWSVTSESCPIGALSTFECWYIDRQDHDLALVFSDGVESFIDAQSKPVPLESVLDELLAIKGLQGQFLSRRCGRFLTKTCVERGWVHSDDLSVAGIYLGGAP
jgi:protein phosphatase 2C-like protein